MASLSSTNSCTCINMIVTIVRSKQPEVWFVHQPNLGISNNFKGGVTQIQLFNINVKESGVLHL